MPTTTGYETPAIELKKFTQAELGEAFEKIADPNDWRTAIDAVVPTSTVSLYRAAVNYFTGATLHDVCLGDGNSRIVAEGSIPGPAN